MTDKLDPADDPWGAFQGSLFLAVPALVIDGFVNWDYGPYDTWWTTEDAGVFWRIITCVAWFFVVCMFFESRKLARQAKTKALAPARDVEHVAAVAAMTPEDYRQLGWTLADSKDLLGPDWPGKVLLEEARKAALAEARAELVAGESAAREAQVKLRCDGCNRFYRVTKTGALRAHECTPRAPAPRRPRQPKCICQCPECLAGCGNGPCVQADVGSGVHMICSGIPGRNCQRCFVVATRPLGHGRPAKPMPRRCPAVAPTPPRAPRQPAPPPVVVKVENHIYGAEVRSTPKRKPGPRSSA